MKNILKWLSIGVYIGIGFSVTSIGINYIAQSVFSSHPEYIEADKSISDNLVINTYRLVERHNTYSVFVELVNKNSVAVYDLNVVGVLYDEQGKIGVCQDRVLVIEANTSFDNTLLCTLSVEKYPNLVLKDLEIKSTRVEK